MILLLSLLPAYAQTPDGTGSTLPDPATTNVEAANPNVEAANPNVEAANPNVEAANPDLETTTPKIEHGIPKLESDTPKLDLGQSDASRLQGGVTELDSINAKQPKLYPEMPKLDCLSFSARSRKDLLQSGVRTEYGNLGISWVPGEYPHICGVTGGGGAERAGIKAGDTLIAVNGVSAYGLSPESVNNLVTGIRGQTAMVSITRGGAPYNVYAQYTGIQDLSAFEQPRATWWLNYWRRQ